MNARVYAELVGSTDVVVRPDGTRLHVVIDGPADGPPVVLAHGYGATLETWSLVQPALVEQGLRVIAYEHRAHGRSTIGRDGTTSEALFADLKAVVEKYELDDVILVGHSMGTFTLMGALADEALRAKTRAVVLVAAETGTLLKGASLSVKVLAPIAGLGVLPAIMKVPGLGSYSARQLCGSAATPEVVEATRLMMADGTRATRGFIAMMNDESVASALPLIDKPTTVIWGADDGATPEWHARLIAEKVPDCKLVIAPGVGHMANWEAAGDVIAAVLSAAPASVAA